MDRVLAEELESLLGSPAFMRSPVLCRLLSYLVEYRLNNEGPPPKAYVIATEALGRPADFDPSIDSYPRVMVGRLRTLMERHYSETPWLHRLRIPQGSYEVVVQYRAAPPTRGGGDAASVENHGGTADAVAPVPAPPVAPAGPKSFVPAARPSSVADPASWMDGSVHDLLGGDADRKAEQAAAARAGLKGWKRWAVMAAAMCVAALLGGGAAMLVSHYTKDAPWFSAGRSALVPRVSIQLVVEDGALDQSNAVVRQALEHKLRDALRRFEMFEMFEAVEGGKSGKSGVADGEVAAADYVVRGFVEASRGDVSFVNISLSHPATSRTLWSRRLTIPQADEGQLPQVDPIVTLLAGSYGIITRDQIRRAPNDYRPGAPCFAQFQRFRKARSGSDMDALNDCMQGTEELAPQDPLALSAMSSLKWYATKVVASGPKLAALQREATAYAERAYDAAPASAYGVFAQAQAHFFKGDCQQMAATVSSGQPVNEFDASMLGQFGFYHVVCRYDAIGEGYLQRADRLHERPPALGTSVLAMLKAERGEAAEAIRLLQSIANVEHEQAAYLAISAYVFAKTGQMEAARQHWEKLNKLAGLGENARAEDVLRRFTVSDMVVERVLTDLREVGVVPPRAAKN